MPPKRAPDRQGQLDALFQRIRAEDTMLKGQKFLRRAQRLQPGLAVTNAETTEWLNRPEPDAPAEPSTRDRLQVYHNPPANQVYRGRISKPPEPDSVFDLDTLDLRTRSSRHPGQKDPQTGYKYKFLVMMQDRFSRKLLGRP